MKMKEVFGSKFAARCLFAFLLPGSVTAVAQLSPSGSAAIALYTPRQLRTRAAELKRQAATSGSASVVLARYPGHFTMLGYRDKTGDAELHANAADIDVILNGEATLVTGGTLVDAKTTGHGEQRGTSIQGGNRQPLHTGDIVHIPAGTAHQMLLPPGGSITYFVIKALVPKPR